MRKRSGPRKTPRRKPTTNYAGTNPDCPRSPIVVLRNANIRFQVSGNGSVKSGMWITPKVPRGIVLYHFLPTVAGPGNRSFSGTVLELCSAVGSGGRRNNPEFVARYHKLAGPPHLWGLAKS